MTQSSAATMQQLLALTITLYLTVILIGIPQVQGASQNVNNDGNITWADLPEGEAYSARSEYDEGAFPLPTTWDLIDGFLKLISPAPPPYELINDAIGGQLDISTLTGKITEFQGNLMGFAICFVIGALFVVIFPIVCLCFCCCRCCNNCGGKMYQEQSDSDRCKRVCFAVSLVIITAVLAGGIGTAYSVNSFMSTTVDTLPEDIIANIDDILAYVNNTLGEITFLVDDQLGWTLDELGGDLEDIGTLVGEPVRDQLNTNVGPALDAVYALSDAIDNTYDAMNQVDTTQNLLDPQWVAFRSDLQAVHDDIVADCGTCGCCGGTYPDESGLTVLANYRDLSNGGRYPQIAVDAALPDLLNIKNQDLSAAADVGKQSFEDIPETLKNTTNDAITDILNTLDQLKEEIPKLLNETESQLSGLDGMVEPYKADINKYGGYIQDYDMYRVYAVYALYAVFCLIVLLNVLGMMCGWCGFDRDATPTLRGGVSNCGGLTLMSAVGISMIFATFYMLFTSLTFIIGGPIDRLVCDPVVSRQLFTETVDQEDAIVPGYYLGDTLFQNSSIPLTVTGILEGCEENKGVYEVFKLEYFFNVSELLDFNQFIPDINDQFTNISGDFSSIKILTDDTRDILNDFKNSPVDTIDWTVTKAELEKDLTNEALDPNDLSVYAAQLRSFAETLGSPDQATFEGHADTIDGLQTTYVAPLLASAAQMVTEIETLETYTSSIDTSVDNTLTAADNAQNYIDNNVDGLVTSEVVKYADRILGYPEQFVEYALEQVTTEVGRCEPIANLWNSATRILCRNLLESFNAIWLTLGWCTFFLMPSIIFGVKLAKHYRIMDYEDSYDEYLTPQEMEMAHLSQQSPMYPASNKVAPGHV
ncbi:prominin-1-A-like isoform X2 [Amphiura filiformis]|uniref:prominin-1-A-like isoform X2 n=1 Tax=Amphiura filiformis TaxID=82378 RepID=UPI003B212D93